MIRWRTWFAAGLLALMPAQTFAQGWSLPPAGYTYKPSPPCLDDPIKAEKPLRPGAAVYAVCKDQMPILSNAIEQAAKDGKLLIVTVGATWCPWCAALQRLISGPEFFERKGDALDYRRTFNHLEIGVSTTHKGRNALIPSGQAVEQNLMARTTYGQLDSIPFIFILDPAQPDRVFARHTRDLSNSGTGEQNMAGFRKAILEGHAFLKAPRKAQVR